MSRRVAEILHRTDSSRYLVEIRISFAERIEHIQRVVFHLVIEHVLSRWKKQSGEKRRNLGVPRQARSKGI